MAFTPIPLPHLLRRAFQEYAREGKIFDLPKSKFFRGLPGLDLSVHFHGHRAATPLGPAAGPHGQLAQNIALCWLAGARIIELKTVQVLDQLDIPRPCIDAANVGYNVEWSQELLLEESLREYVTAAMFLEILQASGILSHSIPGETVFDMSVGYNLDGLRSPRMRSWLATMKNAATVIDQLRASLTGDLDSYRHLPFRTSISDTVSLSTFHGCPAGEIESIAEFLMGEMGLHLCIKLNPTLLGEAETGRLLHDVLGYREIQLHPPAFQNDLQWDEALDLIPRLRRRADALGRHLSVKFSNTLVVRNHKGIFHDDLMYMSGAPLHVLALRLAEKFRAAVAEPVPISFSGGIDAHNFPDAVALGFVPVTTCTDLLRPGGYARLHRYFEILGERMRTAGAATIADFVRLYGPQAETADAAAASGRYSHERNHGTPRKVGSQLWIYDCLTCEKCVPICPNDANFVYETAPVTIEYENFQLLPGRIRAIPGGVLRVVKQHQFANFADACNDCGNCDIFCPEQGGPQHAKPRFFGSLPAWQKRAGANGFYLDAAHHTIYGAIDGKSYVLALYPKDGLAWYATEDSEVEVRLADHQVQAWRPKGDGALTPRTVDMLPYLKLKLLAESIADPRHVNFANVAGSQELPA
jgi:putative selenate reductase